MVCQNAFTWASNMNTYCENNVLITAFACSLPHNWCRYNVFSSRVCITLLSTGAHKFSSSFARGSLSSLYKLLIYGLHWILRPLHATAAAVCVSEWVGRRENVVWMGGVKSYVAGVHKIRDFSLAFGGEKEMLGWEFPEVCPDFKWKQHVFVSKPIVLTLQFIERSHVQLYWCACCSSQSSKNRKLTFWSGVQYSWIFSSHSNELGLFSLFVCWTKWTNSVLMCSRTWIVYHQTLLDV